MKLDEKNYPLELGYIVVAEAARGKKISVKIAEALLGGTTDAGVFATSFAENDRMHRTLEKFGFKPAGKPYAGGNSGRQIQLFLRPAVKTSRRGD